MSETFSASNPVTKRAQPAKPMHSKRPPAVQAGERLWLRRFWMVFGALAVFSIALIGFQTLGKDDEDREVYITLQTRTVAGEGNNVLCKLSLLVDPAQENRIAKRQPELEAVVNAALAEAYEGSRRPALSSVRDRLLAAINEKLPGKLKVRDVFIQELLVGNS